MVSSNVLQALIDLKTLVFSADGVHIFHNIYIRVSLAHVIQNRLVHLHETGCRRQLCVVNRFNESRFSWSNTFNRLIHNAPVEFSTGPSRGLPGTVLVKSFNELSLLLDLINALQPSAHTRPVKIGGDIGSIF